MKAIDVVRNEVAGLHQELVRGGLVAWTSGNISARVPGADLMVIKPSGVPYDELTPATMVVCDLQGEVVEGHLVPSSDVATHAYIYREMAHVAGVVHTHSAYAVAWSALGQSVPCILTAMADEFGGPIPIAPFARIGTEDIGRVVVGALRGSKSPAVLVQNHGPFTVGANARAAVKAAVMCEAVCQSAHLAHQIGEPITIAPDDVAHLHDRYQQVYGQR